MGGVAIAVNMRRQRKGRKTSLTVEVLRPSKKGMIQTDPVKEGGEKCNRLARKSNDRKVRGKKEQHHK